MNDILNDVNETNLVIKSITHFINQQYGKLNMIMFYNDPNIWFIGKELLYGLGYNTNRVKRNLITSSIERKDILLLKPRNLSMGFLFNQNLAIPKGFKINNRGKIITNQNGLAMLIMYSRKPNAIEYKKWITKELDKYVKAENGYAV